ncbi:hypothetical protein BJX66DRAFT_316118 [Aspergillus keveii]|uniref:Uncharacterized protein n=1 Tax=Aspergillus keveii TaxID=714993 RepID=A0ABR4FNG9_9EURO
METSDYEERRRVQNLLAQRIWRQKNRLRQGPASHSRKSHDGLNAVLHWHETQKSSYSTIFEAVKPESVYQIPPPPENHLVSRG